MRQLQELSQFTPHTELAACIKQYNSVGNEIEHRLEKIFLLQKISYLLEEAPPDLELSTWRKISGSVSLETHFQYYGVLRDGSTLVKNIQFADAACQSAIETAPLDMDYFTALQKRNELFAHAQWTTETARAYVQYNRIIWDTFQTDHDLQEKFYRSQHFLSLCYSKLEAIQGVVDQNFSEFETRTLGDWVVNNQNFTLNIAGEEKDLVIRVEGRNSMANEQVLQTYPVSNYFSEEYFAMMMPFKEGDITNFRPLVLSEYVEKGALDNYAATLYDYSLFDIGEETVRMFHFINDFCLKLIESGHYHPDIKLSNILTDGKTIKVSDRKTIINKANPTLSEVLSTPTYAPPEFRACLNKLGTGLNYFKASQTKVDMPAFMSYQVGMALKEFILTALHYPEMNQEMFMSWSHYSLLFSRTNTQIRNLLVLVQELTRTNPKDRLSIQNFELLLSETHLHPRTFLKKLNELSPERDLSYAKEISLVKTILNTPNPSEDLLKNWDELINNPEVAETVFNDPRLNFFDAAGSEINHYLEKIDLLLKEANSRNTSPISVIQTLMGFSSSNISIQDLPAIPIMSPKLIRYFELFEMMPSKLLSEDQKMILRHVYERQMKQFSQQKQYSMSPTPTEPMTEDNISNENEQSDDLDRYDYHGIDSGTFIRKDVEKEAEELDSGTFIRKDVEKEAEELDSGTFIRKDVEKEAEELDSGTLIRKDVEKEDEELDSGTFIRKEMKKEDEGLDSGTFIRKDVETGNEEFDSGTFVRKEVEGGEQNLDSGTFVQKKKLELAVPTYKRALAHFQAEKKPVQNTDSKVADIISTVKRGNKSS